jgi:hypothetical protein
VTKFVLTNKASEVRLQGEDKGEWLTLLSRHLDEYIGEHEHGGFEDLTPEQFIEDFGLYLQIVSKGGDESEEGG